MHKKKYLLLGLFFISTTFLIGCNKKVESAQMSVYVGDKKMIGTYTGTASSDKANGEGVFMGDTVAIDGEFEDGKLINGKVENLSISIPFNNQDLNGTYTGEYNRGIIGTGKFVFTNGTSDLAIEGEFQKNTIWDGKVVDFPLTCEISGKSYNGTYTGTVSQGAITGNGEFKASKIDYIGEMKDGQLYGNGELRNSTYIVHFDDVDRKGVYDGCTLNGLADGEGSFTAKNSDGIKYTYTGQWKNGLYNGQGVQKYNNKDYYIRRGTFTDGNFTPTVSEWYDSAGTDSSAEYNMMKKTTKFINDNEKLFSTKQSAKLLKQTKKMVTKDFSYSKFKNNKTKYAGKVVTFSGEVAHVMQNDDWFGYKATEVIIGDDNYNYYRVKFVKKMDIKENEHITCYAVPMDYSTYKNIYGTYIWSIQMAGICVE